MQLHISRGRGLWITRLAGVVLAVAALGMARAIVEPHGSGHRPGSDDTVSGERFVYQADDGSSMELWLAGAARGSARRLLVTAQHVSGWSGRAAISPDGETIAYTRLPVGAGDPDRAAELWVVRVVGGDPSLVAAGIDLRSALVWSMDSASVLYQRVGETGVQLWRQDLRSGATQLVTEPSTGVSILPIGYAKASNTLLGARFDSQGTDIVRLAGDGDEQEVMHISDGTARDLELSPDAKHVAYLYPDGRSEPPISRAGIVDLQNGTIELLPDTWGEIVGVAWRPDGALLIGSDGERAGLRTDGGLWVYREDAGGFDQPLASSPSGQAVATRHFSGRSAGEPGTAADLILRKDGSGVPIVAGMAARFVGWLAASGSTRFAEYER